MSLNVSSRSYYDWRLNKYIIKINKRSKLKEDIQASFDNSDQTYGSVRNHNNSIADNLLDRNFSVNEPNKVWVSDITYIKTVEETRNKVFAYIETSYNKKRRHKALNNLSIDEFWNKYYNEINSNKAA